jgi:hypothetical protein
MAAGHREILPGTGCQPRAAGARHESGWLSQWLGLFGIMRTDPWQASYRPDLSVFMAIFAGEHVL